MSQPPFGPPPGGFRHPGGEPVPPPIPQAPGAGAPPGGPAPGGPTQDGPVPGGFGAQDSAYGPGSTGQQPPSWHQLPPEQLARMHQPGVVPLRPLTLGDIFGGALQTLRRNPEATIGMGLIVLAVLLVPSLLLTLLAVQALSGVSEVDAAAATGLINVVFSMLSSIALTGMIVHVVGEAVLGERAGLAGTWQTVRGRLPALVGTVLLIGVLFTILAIGLILGIAAVAVAASESGSGVLGVLGILLLVLGGLVVMVWAGCRLSLAPAPVVLERVGPWRGLTRAWQLTKGAQAWRIVGITFLAGIVTTIFATVVQLPVTAVLIFGLESAGLPTSPVSTTVLVTDHLLQLVVGAVTIPFTAGVTALLYLDQRMRREGLDLVLVRAAQDRAASRAR